jgi:L-amino acid N-acyltransferase YncA
MADSPSYRFGPAGSDADLRAILAIQRANTPQALSAAEQEEQGFVTVRHHLSLLRRMNEAFPHAVARDGGGRVVGYALCMLPQFITELPVLQPLFDQLSTIRWSNAPVAQTNFVVMGQVAVAKPHRGQRLVDGMYADLCDRLQPDYSLLVTSVAARNRRSRRVHERTGFVELGRFMDHGAEWLVVGRPTG